MRAQASFARMAKLRSPIRSATCKLGLSRMGAKAASLRQEGAWISDYPDRGGSVCLNSDLGLDKWNCLGSGGRGMRRLSMILPRFQGHL